MKEFLTVKGLRTAYQISGAGKQLLLLHGWGCDLEIFKSLQSQLSERFKVCALDFPGFGQSEEPLSTWGTHEYAEFVKEFMQAVGFDNPILLGHSFGGRVSIVLGAELPIEKMIITGGAGIKPQRTLKYHFKVYAYKIMKRILLFPLWVGLTAPLRERWLQKAGSSDYRAASERMRQVLSRVVNEDLRDLMPKIKASVLLIWGEHDTATPLRDGKLMEQQMPNAGLAIMPGCGHYCFLEKPQHFNLILEAFLKSK
ncbi:MAG: alpha/beta fold hydrolase [Saprospiraceae bacterium]